MQKKANSPVFPIYLKFFLYAKRYKWLFVLSIGLSFLYSLANVYFLPLVKDIISAISKQQLLNFTNYIINALFLFGIRLIAHFSRLYVMNHIGTRMSIDIRLDCFRKLVSFSPGFFDKTHLGDKLARLISDVDVVKRAMVMGVFELIPHTTTLLGVVGYLFYLNWKLTLISLVLVPVFVLIISKISSILRRISKQIRAKSGHITHIMQEALLFQNFVQAYNLEDRIANRLDSESMKQFRSNMQAVKVRNWGEGSVTFLQFVVILFVIWFGGYEVSRGVLSGANLAAYCTGIVLLIDPILAFSKVQNNLQQSVISVIRLYEVLELDDPIKSAGLNLIPDSFKGEVVFEDVWFQYKKEKEYALNGISLSVPAGSSVALVGASGSGKSTLIKLLMRFHDPIKGRIVIDGVPLKDLHLNTLRDHIAYVFQEPVMFRGSIIDNIRFGKLDATEADVIEAAKLANAWDFIQEKPDGLYSQVGDIGDKLSGGQKQRIAIARAILRNPTILILDEATSALDSESEKQVQDALVRLMKNRTTFVIAHRLSTIQHVDEIVVLDQGQICERGTHQALLKNEGVYHKLFNLQFQSLHDGLGVA